MQKKCKRQVKQVFQEVEYIGKYISETKASYHLTATNHPSCQWVLAFPGAQHEKVSFTVQDSTISGKKEILRNGILIYSHVVSNHPRETLYHNAVYNMTLDYYSYYLQHVIHIQVLQKKGIFSKVLPRVFRLFVDGVSFDILPMFFQQDQQDGFLSSSCTPSVSFSSSCSDERFHSRSRSRETTSIDHPRMRLARLPSTSSSERRPVWIIGRNF